MKKNGAFFMLILSFVFVTSNIHVQAAPESTEKNITIEINSLEDFEALAKDSHLDTFSAGKIYELKTDLDLTETDLPYIIGFSGTFHGNGHKISGVKGEKNGSIQGLFRYINAGAAVCDLTVEGNMAPEGSASSLGGICGENFGLISNVTFSGYIKGEKNVGGIVGINHTFGIIENCRNMAEVLGTGKTGGIAGENHGIIQNSTNKGEINNRELQSAMDFDGVEIGDFNLTQNIVSRNDTGGIAGYSTGTIRESINYAQIGRNHNGYNVGGIAGRQKGMITDCVNHGEVLGRKDVGGIVGQAEPYLESEYVSDRISELRSQIRALGSTINSMADTVSSAGDDITAYRESLKNTYQSGAESVKNQVDELNRLIGDEDEKQKQSIEGMYDSLSGIQNTVNNGDILSEENVASMQADYQNLHNEVGNLKDNMISNRDNVSDRVDSVTEEIKKSADSSEADISAMADTVNRSVQEVTKKVKRLTNQAKRVGDTLEKDISEITGGDIVEDISSESIELTSGVINHCRNEAEIKADLNVGGIVGTMNVELDVDPEQDIDFSQSTNPVVRTKVANRVLYSINYGIITGKRSDIGGIVGQQSLGLIYGCEGYGEAASEEGKYLGNICGNSSATIASSYSFGYVRGKDYLGGICGYGYTIKDCISMSDVEGTGECFGSIAGFADSEGELSKNYYCNESLSAVDSVSYGGRAEFLPYEDIIEMEGTPKKFRAVKISFLADSKEIGTKTLAYNSGINRDEFPGIPDKEGYYSCWPEDMDLSHVTENLKVEAEYHQWIESLASDIKAKSGIPVMLVIGKFYETTGLTVEESKTEGDNPEYTYKYSLSGEQKFEEETLEVHLFRPEKMINPFLYCETEDGWKETAVTTDGQYLVASVPIQAALKITDVPVDKSGYILIGAAVGGILVVLLSIRQYNKKRKR